MTDQSLTSLLTECALDLLETEDKVSAEKVVQCARYREPDIFTKATERMVLASARRQAASIMRGLTEDDGTPETLPGLGFPSAIGVVTPDGTYWKRTDKATLPELRAGRVQRVHNVTAAQAKLDEYDAGLDIVTPVMEGDDGMTVADALRLMAGEA